MMILAEDEAASLLRIVKWVSLFFVSVATCVLVNESLPLKMFVLPAFIKRQNAVQSIHMLPHPHKEHKQKRQGKSR